MANTEASLQAPLQTIDVFVMVDDGSKINLIRDMRRDIGWHFSTTIQRQLDEAALSAHIGDPSSSTRAQPLHMDVVISSTSRKFPGVQAFRPVFGWMRDNSMRSTTVAHHKHLISLLPSHELDIPLLLLVDVLSAAEILGITNLSHVTYELRENILRLLEINRPLINHHTIQHIYDRLGHKKEDNPFMQKVAFVYWKHVAHERLPRNDPQMIALFESEAELGSLFESARLARIHDKIRAKRQRGDILPQDIPYLIL